MCGIVCVGSYVREGNGLAVVLLRCLLDSGQ